MCTLWKKEKKKNTTLPRQNAMNREWETKKKNEMSEQRKRKCDKVVGKPLGEKIKTWNSVGMFWWAVPWSKVPKYKIAFVKYQNYLNEMTRAHILSPKIKKKKK